jgi:hypothetical protein
MIIVCNIYRCDSHTHTHINNNNKRKKNRKEERKKKGKKRQTIPLPKCPLAEEYLHISH